MFNYYTNLVHKVHEVSIKLFRLDPYEIIYDYLPHLHHHLRIYQAINADGKKELCRKFHS